MSDEKVLGTIYIAFAADDGIGPFISEKAWVSLGNSVTRWAVAHNFADIDITISVSQHAPPEDV